MKKIRSVILLATCMVLFPAFMNGQQMVKENRNLSGFDGIGFGISGNLYISFGSDFKVVVEASKDFADEILTEVRNGKLHIRRENFNFFGNEKANVYVTLPRLTSLNLSGSGKAEVEGTLKTDRIDLSVSGSGKINIPELSVSEMGCSISGSGDIYLGGGQVGTAKLSISGSGGYSGENASIRSFQASISGSGSCNCKVEDELVARISGSGNIYYSGNPRLDVKSSGSGHVRSR
ncbi:MAG: head GIN domain-containing protein [Bacteroidales bacterium]